VAERRLHVQPSGPIPRGSTRQLHDPIGIKAQARAERPHAATESALGDRCARIWTKESRWVIVVLPAVRRQGLFGWTPVVAVGGQTAVWISRAKAFHELGFTITLLRFDQALVTLALHAGGSQPGGLGWRYGDSIGRGEARIVVAAFNSAFQENYGAGGFEEGGRVGWPLRRAPASVVIYRDGIADIGRWHDTVPAAGRPCRRSDRTSAC
jgi:hypothetical protein